MSGTLRSYSRRYAARRGMAGRGGCIAPLALAILLCGGIWALWTTRDSYPMSAFIAADRAYEIYADDFLNKRERLAASAVWKLFPKDSPLATAPARLSENLGMPSWVLNNLAYGACHVSGFDLNGFPDAVLVTRMSRVGCLLEKFHSFFIKGIESDSAGGLDLRQVTKEGLYYAVRGRILLASPSRTALIGALTLRSEDAGGASFGEETAPGSEPDIRGIIRPSAGSALGEAFKELRLSLVADGLEASLQCEGALRPEWRQRFSTLLENAAPAPLLRPSAGPIAISGNFGASVPVVWRGLRNILGDAPWLDAALDSLNGFAGDGAIPVAETFGPLLAKAGPGWTLTWQGFAEDAILPAPAVTGYFQVNAAEAAESLKSLPALPAGEHAWEPKGYFDPETNRAWVPLMGGPGLSPAAALAGDWLLLGTGASAFQRALDAPSAEYLEASGNLHISIAPLAAIEALRQAGMAFAEFGALRGLTPEQLQDALRPWAEKAGSLQSLDLLATRDGTLLRLNLDVALAAQQ